MDELDLGATIRGFSPGQKVFGRFILQRVLGRGGMGVVWLARDAKLEEPVALKFLPEVVKLDPGALDDLKRETKRARQLTHPNIVRIHDFLEDATSAAIAMEAVEGTTLAQLRVEQATRAFEVAAIRDWVRQLCLTLDYAHLDARVVHRDLKPANIMLDPRGRVKITDFGISQSLSDSLSRASMQRSSSGTPAYMSPQQMLGEKPSPADDIYALGATIYELLTSRPPFYSGNLIAQVQSIVPPPMATRRADLEIEGGAIPGEWESTIAACLAKDQAARPPSAGEVWARLAAPATVAVMAPVAPPAPSAQSATVAPAEPPVIARRSSAALGAGIVLLVGFVFVLLVGAGFVIYWNKKPAAAVPAPINEVIPPSVLDPVSPTVPAGEATPEQQLAESNQAVQQALPVPEVTPLLPAGSELKTVRVLAADGEAVYAAGETPGGRSSIVVVDLTARDDRTLFYPISPVTGLAIDGDNLYWMDPSSGPATDTQIWKAAKDGTGDAAPIYTGVNAGEVIVDGGGLALLPGLGTDLVSFGPDQLVAVDQVGGRVATLRLDNHLVKTVVDRRYAGGFAAEHFQSIASDGAAGFIVGGSGKEGVAPPEVVHYPQWDAAEVKVLWSGAPLVSPQNVASDGSVVFVADPAAGNTVWCVPIDGGVIRRLPLAPDAFKAGESLGGIAWDPAGGLFVGISSAEGGNILRLTNLPTRGQLIFGQLADVEGTYFTDSGLGVKITQEGEGMPLTAGTRVRIDFLTYDLAGNLVSHSTRDHPVSATIGEGQLVAGLEEGLLLLRSGATAQLLIPPALGSAGLYNPPVPANPGGVAMTVIVKIEEQ